MKIRLPDVEDQLREEIRLTRAKEYCCNRAAVVACTAWLRLTFASASATCYDCNKIARPGRQRSSLDVTTLTTIQADVLYIQFVLYNTAFHPASNDGPYMKL